MGTSWVSEPNKNLLCSVFVVFDDLPVAKQVSINYAVSLAVIRTLNRYCLPKLSVKWPNDILSYSQKLCGILVENVIQSNKVKSSVIGVGINVNQIKYPSYLHNVTSMKLILKKDIDLEELLSFFLEELKNKLANISEGKSTTLKKEYLSFLYKKNIPTMFKNSRDVLFMGKIVGVSSDGKLQIQMEDDSISEFGIKEVSIA